MSVVNKITIKQVQQIFKNIIFDRQVKVPLGRWQLNYNKSTIDRTIMYSNEDNCGVCSSYIDTINIGNKNDKSYSDTSYNDEYIWLISANSDKIK